MALATIFCHVWRTKPLLLLYLLTLPRCTAVLRRTIFLALYMYNLLHLLFAAASARRHAYALSVCGGNSFRRPTAGGGTAGILTASSASAGMCAYSRRGENREREVLDGRTAWRRPTLRTPATLLTREGRAAPHFSGGSLFPSAAFRLRQAACAVVASLLYHGLLAPCCTRAPRSFALHMLPGVHGAAMGLAHLFRFALVKLKPRYARILLACLLFYCCSRCTMHAGQHRSYRALAATAYSTNKPPQHILCRREPDSTTRVSGKRFRNRRAGTWRRRVDGVSDGAYCGLRTGGRKTALRLRTPATISRDSLYGL